MSPTENVGNPGLEIERRAGGSQRPLGLEQPVRAARHGRGVERRQRLLVGPRVVEQPAHDPVDTLELARHPGDHLGVRAPPPQHLDVRAERAQRVPHFVGDSCGEATYPCELFRAHQLALRVEQMVGHAVETLGEGGEVVGLGVRGAARQVAVRYRVGRGHHALERPQH